MQVVKWIIDFAIKYPPKCTVKQFRRLLEELAAHWPGWEHYPWRVTRKIHRFIDAPPVNFHYLLIQHFVTAHSAHILLHADFENRDELLEMMIREQFQFVGVYRLMLIDALRFEMRYAKSTEIPDCTGPEEGHKNVTAEELEKRRHTFRGCVEDAERDFIRILNMASQSEDMSQWINGRRLSAWLRGGDLPEPETLEVRIAQMDGHKVLMPQKSEAADMIRAGKTVARLEIKDEAGDLKPEEEKPDDHGKRICGKRFEIAADYGRVTDKKTKRVYVVEGLSAQIALRVMVEMGIFENNKRTAPTLIAAVNKQREAMGKAVIKTQSLIHVFRYRTKKRDTKELYGFYGELVRVDEKAGLYWLEP